MLPQLSISRRRFLGVTGGLVTSAALGSGLISHWRQFPKERLLVSGHREAGAHDFLAVQDILLAKSLNIPAPSEGHSILSHPSWPKEAIVLPKRAPSAYRIVLSKGGTPEIFTASPGSLFYGHGVYEKKGDYFLTSEHQKGAGKIVVRDARNLKIVSELQSYGEGPHDLALIDEGRTLAVANGEGLSSIAIIELKTGKLLEKITTPHPKVSLRHLSFGTEGEFAVATQSLDLFDNPGAPLLFGTRGGLLREAVAPAPILDSCRVQLLSILFHAPSGRLAVTCPATNNVSIWDFASGTWLKSFHLPEASGLAFLHQKDSFIVHSAREIDGLSINPWTLQSESVAYTGLTGSHLAVI